MFLIVSLIASKWLIGFDLLHLLASEFKLDKMIHGSVYAIILNSLLFLGFLIQYTLGVENLISIPNSNIILFKENFYGPFIEEIIYRLAMFNLLKYGGWGTTWSCILSSFMFGLCNLK
jgi:hypothetical protein